MHNATQKSLVTLLCSAALLAGCGSKGSSSTPSVDTTPNAFSFVDQNGVALSSVVTSAPVTITGIDSPAAVTVSGTGGTYSVGCTTTYINTSSTIVNNETVCVRHTSSSSPSTTVNTLLTVGGVSDTFSSTTAASGGADTTPDAFSFTDKTGVALATQVTSDPITITGINAPATVTVSGTGGMYSVGCTATYIDTSSTIENNETVCVRHTSSASANTAVDTVLTIGGVIDTFTSTTALEAAPVVSLLPFLTGAGDVKLFDPTVVASGTNPKTVDSGLTPPPITPFCDDCFAQATTFHTGTVSVSTVSNLRAARLAYVKRGSGNNTGGLVYVVNTDKGADNTPTSIGLILDACAIVKTQTTDFLDVDRSALVLERAGLDLSCSTRTDNVVTVIRLDSLITDLGTTIALALDAGNPLHAQTNALGEITGYLSFEIGGTLLVPTFNLVRRDANLANPVSLLLLESGAGVDTTGVNFEQSDLTHLFVTAIPAGQGLNLYRVESAGTLSPVLHSFVGFNAGNPIQDALHDATHLYFSDENRLLRTPVGSNSTADVTILTTMVHPVPSETLRIGNRAIDTSTTPARVVFEATDTGLTVDSGVFSVAANAVNATATVLDKYPDSLGGSATIVAVSNGRAYINHVDHGDQDFDGDADDALRINTDGTGAVTVLSAYWPGRQRATTFDLSLGSAPPITALFLATRVVTGLLGSSTGLETLRLVDPVTGAAGIVLGSVSNAANFQAIKIDGLGRYALARVEISRSDIFDNDVYSLDTGTASSLMPLAQTAGANDVLLRD